MTKRIQDQLSPFDPTDPLNRVADHYRKAIAELVSAAAAMEDNRGLSEIDQLEAFMTGAATGLIGVLFASTRRGAWDEVMTALISYLPQARAQVEGVFENADRKIN